MRDIKYIDVEKISEMIHKAENKRDQLIMKIFFATFCRSNELRQIRISDINFSRGNIKFRAETTKTKKPRIAVIPKELVEDIKSFIGKNKEDRYLFETRQSELISNKRIQQIIRKYADDIGINTIYNVSKDNRKLSSVTPHTLRHSAIIHALDKGIPQTAVMQQSGHTSLSSFQIYTQFSVEDRRKLFNDRGFYNLE